MKTSKSFKIEFTEDEILELVKILDERTKVYDKGTFSYELLHELCNMLEIKPWQL